MAELLIVLTIIVLFFGANRVPQLGRSLGKGIREFRKGISGHDDDAELQDRKNEGEGEKPSPSEAAPGMDSPAEGEENARTGQKL